MESRNVSNLPFSHLRSTKCKVIVITLALTHCAMLTVIDFILLENVGLFEFLHVPDTARAPVRITNTTLMTSGSGGYELFNLINHHT